MANVEDLDSIPDHTHDKKNSWLLPVRIVLFALLGVAIIGLIFDQLARRRAQAAFDAVNDAMGEEGKLVDLSREDVRNLMGRAPDDDGDAEDVFETFSWPGALKSQVIFVEYRHGDEKLLKDVSLNEKPPGFP